MLTTTCQEPWGDPFACANARCRETGRASGRLSRREFARPATKRQLDATGFIGPCANQSEAGEERVTTWKFLLPQKVWGGKYHNCDISWLILAKSFAA